MGNYFYCKKEEYDRVHSEDRAKEDALVKKKWNRGFYYGDMTEGVPNGYGTWYIPGTTEPAIMYIGEWKNGRYHGKGRILKTSLCLESGKCVKSVTQGEFCEGKHHGEFIKIWEDYVKVATWVNNKPVGPVKLYKNGVLHWECVIVGDDVTAQTRYYGDGRIYTGEMREFIPDGEGVMKYPDGSYLKGQFMKGEFSGKGEMVTVDGRTVVGVFWNGQLLKEGPTQ